MTDDSVFDAPDRQDETLASARDSPSLEPARIQRCERLFGLGILTTSLLHALNNPLNAILMNAELGLRRLQQAPDPDELIRILQKIRQEAQRGGALTHGVAEFAKADCNAPTGCVDLNHVVMEARNLAHAVLRRNAVQLSWELNPEGPAVKLHATAMALAMAQLLHNAAEAGASQVRLTTGNNAGWIIVTVADNGAGIPPEHLSAIFEPFFTTRRTQGNIGLGLSLARAIIADHGGRIEARSAPGDTQFVIYLPH